ncbi:MAG: BatA domain-containing protein [Planctomycetota bacterium]|nr:BatA domain-containing protein [Planctomycetota bacterium]
MIPSGFLFALTLAQPWLLLFGLAALVPVLIHFLHRHQHRKLKWAATRYLALAMEKVWRRFSMIQLWLLLLRVTLLLLLSICLATPVLERKESWLEGSGPGSTLKIIAMDTSYSMLARDSVQAGSGQGQDQAPTDQQRQDRARQLASQLVEQSGPGDAFLLVTFDDRLTPVLTAPQASRDAVIDRINLVSPGNRPNQLPPVLEALGELVENHLSSPYDQVELHLVSDFAGANWSSLQEEPTRSAWKS